MAIILSLHCLVVQNGGSRILVAGFTASRLTVQMSPYLSSSSPPLVPSTTTSATSRIHKTHLWYNYHEDESDSDDKFLNPGGEKKKKMDVTVDVDVQITRGNEETNYESSQEFDQKEFTVAGNSPSPSSSDEIMVVSSPLVFEDFVDNSINVDFVVEDQEEEEETEDAAVQEMSETPPSLTLLNAIEPTKDKPTKKFISPIELIKRVPRVEPINMTSVFFVKTMPLEHTSFPGAASAGAAATGDTKRDTFSIKKSSADKVVTWKDRMLSQQRRPTAFQATNYLESLGSTADSSSSTNNKSSASSSSNSNENEDNNASNQQQEEDPENNNDAMYKNLKAQQGNFREEQHKSMQEAIYAAMRRTNPKDVVEARVEKREKKRKRIERERLEREYVERKERLDAKKWEDEEALEKEEKKRRKSRRGLPILGPFIKSPSPLLIGSTLAFQYSELNLFQKKALEVSQYYHEEHCARMKEATDKAGEEGGIQAAPIVAVIDRFTGDYAGSSSSGDEQKKNKRFATLSAVEIEPSQDGTGPAVVKLTGIGRVFLYDYFSSKDAGITEEEEELENILKLIQEFDKAHEDEEDDKQEDDDDDLPVVIASFDVILDDSSILANQSTKYQDATVHRASSVHAIAELYRTANRVYRLHEERKKIVAGLKAAEERLLLGKKRMNENCDIEYEDCDGLGMFSGGVDFLSNEVVEAEEITTGTALLSPLAQMENYGFGSFGILSTIPDLTNELMLYLESYYSPSHREREEYEAEIASFIALRCLEEYVDPSDIAAAMLTPSATERLNMSYELMMRHKEELNELVKMISDNLFECGAECKDLF